MTFGARGSRSGTLQGYALITSLVFLAVLTTVGIFTLRNTALEIKMSANHNKSTQAFEAAEATRRMVSQLIDPHIDNRGWPKRAGGMIEDDRFDGVIPAGIVLLAGAEGTGPRHWYDDALQASSSFSPLDLSEIDVRYNQVLSGNTAAGFELQGRASVRTLRTDIEAGSNSAMSSGYEGLGKSSAAGGANMFLYVVAEGQDPGSQATSHTAAVYRYVMQN